MDSIWIYKFISIQNWTWEEILYLRIYTIEQKHVKKRLKTFLKKEMNEVIKVFCLANKATSYNTFKYLLPLHLNEAG